VIDALVIGITELSLTIPNIFAFSGGGMILLIVIDNVCVFPAITAVSVLF